MQNREVLPAQKSLKAPHCATNSIWQVRSGHSLEGSRQECGCPRCSRETLSAAPFWYLFSFVSEESKRREREKKINVPESSVEAFGAVCRCGAGTEAHADPSQMWLMPNSSYLCFTAKGLCLPINTRYTNIPGLHVPPRAVQALREGELHTTCCKWDTLGVGLPSKSIPEALRTFPELL